MRRDRRALSWLEDTQPDDAITPCYYESFIKGSQSDNTVFMMEVPTPFRDVDVEVNRTGTSEFSVCGIILLTFSLPLIRIWQRDRNGSNPLLCLSWHTTWNQFLSWKHLSGEVPWVELLGGSQKDDAKDKKPHRDHGSIYRPIYDKLVLDWGLRLRTRSSASQRMIGSPWRRLFGHGWARIWMRLRTFWQSNAASNCPNPSKSIESYVTGIENYGLDCKPKLRRPNHTKQVARFFVESRFCIGSLCFWSESIHCLKLPWGLSRKCKAWQHISAPGSQNACFKPDGFCSWGCCKDNIGWNSAKLYQTVHTESFLQREDGLASMPPLMTTDKWATWFMQKGRVSSRKETSSAQPSYLIDSQISTSLVAVHADHRARNPTATNDRIVIVFALNEPGTAYCLWLSSLFCILDHIGPDSRNSCYAFSHLEQEKRKGAR